MEVYKFCPRDYFGANSFVIISGDEAAIVDPSVPLSRISSVIGDARLKYVLLTHCHFDHILSLEDIVKATGARVIIGENDRGGLSSPIVNCYRTFLGTEDGYYGDAQGVVDGEHLALGTEDITVVATPGHTAGGVSYLIGDSLFVGDTVFAGGGYGRCDLPGGDEAVLFSSIARLFALRDPLTVYCGHGEDTTLSEIKRNFM